MTEDRQGGGKRGEEVLTVGHSTLPIEQFIELLERGRVEAIADVRRHPGSRRNPQFGAESLARSLAAAKVSYHPFGEQLGGRRSRRRAGPAPGRSDIDPVNNSAWRNPSFRAYADHLAGADFAAGLNRLESLAREKRTAIMCAEAHPSRCHRQLIADVLVARGWRVVHLLSGGRSEAHALSPHAIIEQGRVSYPARQQTLEV